MQFSIQISLGFGTFFSCVDNTFLVYCHILEKENKFYNIFLDGQQCYPDDLSLRGYVKLVASKDPTFQH